MIKISDALEAIISSNEALRFGLHHRLFNLSQLARFLAPLVEARSQKQVKASAIQMSLSRLQARVDDAADPARIPFRLEKVHIHPGLCSLTASKTPHSHQDFGRIYGFIQERQGFITITEGMGEITAIFDAQHLPRVRKLLHDPPRIQRDRLASVGIRFHERYLDVPGVLHQILQVLAMQGLNVVELASTSTEFTVYLHEQDVELAFESIYGRFAARDGG